MTYVQGVLVFSFGFLLTVSIVGLLGTLFYGVRDDHPGVLLGLFAVGTVLGFVSFIGALRAAGIV